MAIDNPFDFLLNDPAGTGVQQYAPPDMGVPPAVRAPLPEVPGIQVGEMPTPMAPPAAAASGFAAAPQTMAYRRAMRGIEGGNYSNITDAGPDPRTGRQRRVYGAYQVEEANIPEWTRRWIGRSMTPQEFLNDSEAQDRVFDGQFNEYIQRFGGPQAAAEAWIGGPGGVGRADRRDRFGTTPVAHGRNFMSALSRIGVQQQEPPSPVAGTMQMGPGMAEATGQPGMEFPMMRPGQQPMPTSPQALAMTPQALRPTMARQPDILGSFINQLMGGDATRPAIAQGYLDYLRGAPSGSELRRSTQTGVAEVFTRGQELRLENPQATPQQLGQLLIRDPVWGRNAIALGANAPAVLQAAVTPPQPPQMQAVNPGATMLGPNATGQMVPQFTAPTAEMALMQQWQSMTPEQRMQFQQTRREMQAPRPPSDTEEALNELVRTGVITQQEALLARSPLYSLQPARDNYGNITGYDVVERLTGNVVSGPTARRMGQPPRAPLGSPGGLGAAPASPPAGAAPGQEPPVDTTQLDTRLRPVGTSSSGQQVLDTPGLSLSTSVMERPEFMALGTGPFGAFRGQWGRIIGNLPGMQGTNEATLIRQQALQQFRASYASYRRGVRLAGEHAETMAEVPGASEINTNPLRSVNQLIAIREQLLKNLQLAESTASNDRLANQTRTRASDSVAEIHGVLLRLPTLVQLHNLRRELASGAQPEETGVPIFGDISRQTRDALSILSGGEAPTPTERPQRTPGAPEDPLNPTVRPPTLATPPRRAEDERDLTTLSDQRLEDLFKRPNTSSARRAEIRAEAARRANRRQEEGK